MEALPYARLDATCQAPTTLLLIPRGAAFIHTVCGKDWTELGVIAKSHGVDKEAFKKTKVEQRLPQDQQKRQQAGGEPVIM